jgi:hypothetical protein
LDQLYTSSSCKLPIPSHEDIYLLKQHSIAEKIFASFLRHGRKLHQDLAAGYGSRSYGETDWKPYKPSEHTRMLLDEEALAVMDAADDAAAHAAMRAVLERAPILVPSEDEPFPFPPFVQIPAGPAVPPFPFPVVEIEDMLAKIRETIEKEEAKANEKASHKA